MKDESSQQIFEKNSNMNFHENPSVEAELFLRTDRQTDGGTDGETVITKVIVAFRSFANEPCNCSFALVLL